MHAVTNARGAGGPGGGVTSTGSCTAHPHGKKTPLEVACFSGVGTKRTEKGVKIILNKIRNKGI